MGAALAAGALLALTGCGGSGEAAESTGTDVLMEGEQLEALVTQVDKMGVIEWHGQLLTKSPDNGGKRIFDLDGRFSPSTGYSELSMDSVLDGNAPAGRLPRGQRSHLLQQRGVGPERRDCWADITDDTEGRTWALPTRARPDLAGHDRAGRPARR